jgi:hypothetical protein
LTLGFPGLYRVFPHEVVAEEVSDETYCVSEGLTLDTPDHQDLYGIHLELRPVDFERSY